LALRRSTAYLAELAMLAFVLRVTQGFADIFWVAGPLTAALILAGLGLTNDPGTDDDSGRARDLIRRPTTMFPALGLDPGSTRP